MSELIAVPLLDRVTSDSPYTVVSDLESFIHKTRAKKGRVTGLICSPYFLWQAGRAGTMVMEYSSGRKEQTLMGIPIREVKDLVGLVLIAVVE